MVESEGSSQHCPITDEGVHPFVSSFRRRVVSIVLRRPIPKCLCWGFKTLPSPQRLHPQREPSPEPQAQEGDQQSKRRHLREVQNRAGGQNTLWVAWRNMAYATITTIKPNSAPPTPPNSARRKLS